VPLENTGTEVSPSPTPSALKQCQLTVPFRNGAEPYLGPLSPVIFYSCFSLIMYFMYFQLVVYGSNRVKYCEKGLICMIQLDISSYGK
jgi:hypothetical protein